MFGFSVLKKIWAALIAAVTLLAVAAEKGAPPPEGAELTGSDTFVLTDALLRGQGITTDGTYYYYSGNFFLSKSTLDNRQTAAVNRFAIPPRLLAKGCNHIGGISWYDGKIYAAIEDGSDYLHPFIAVYDAETLRFTGQAYELPQSLHIDGVPWCAVDGPRGCLYTAEWSNAKALNVFRLEDMSFVKTVPLSMTLDRIQGGNMYGGTLYLSADLGDAKPVYAVDPATGECRLLFSRNVGAATETESMTVWPMPDGSLFHVQDIGPDRYYVTVRHYR